jgi:DNA (cytosine-5)-methyltransferase 1
MNFYNEHDPKAAAWLRELIKHGHIPNGVVDERSIEDIKPSELDGFIQCHFFAGIGGWSLALKLAGWPEGKPVWTGSCPCQPFSTAGKGGGFADERHLWPAFYHLISQCNPPVVFGEQVASKDGLTWLDLVRADCEASGYAVGAVDLCAASVGAPHIRQRLWWVADSVRGRQSGLRVLGRSSDSEAGSDRQENRAFHVGWSRGMANPTSREEHQEQRGPSEAQGGRSAVEPGGCGVDCGMADTGDTGPSRAGSDTQHQGPLLQFGDGGGEEIAAQPSPTNGFWRAADWLHCRDGKWRPVEPATFPLAHGIPARVVRLRGYGNAIVPQVGAEFVKAFLETEGGITLPLRR